MNKKKSSIYAWVIVAVCFFIMFGAYTIMNTLHSLFLRPVTEDLGISVKAFSFVFAIGGIGVAVGSAFMGKLLTKGNMKLIMTITLIISSLGFMSYSLATNIVAFYIIAFVVGVSSAGFANIPISIMLTNWFHEKRGLALSIAFLGGGVGTALMSPILSSIMSNYGWKTSYIIAGIGMLVLSLPLILFLAAKTPADKGMLAYGADSAAAQDQSAVHTEDLRGLTLQQAKKTSMFWIFIVGMISIALVAGGVQMHVPSFLQSVGHSGAFAATILSALALAGIIGKLVFGVVLDKFKTSGSTVYALIMMIVALGSLLMAKAVPMAFVFAIAYGFGIVIAGLGPTFMTGDIFGRKDYGAIFGFIQVFFVAGSSIGVVASGFIYDATKSYNFAWIFFLALFVIGSACILIANGMKKKALMKAEAAEQTLAA